MRILLWASLAVVSMLLSGCASEFCRPRQAQWQDEALAAVAAEGSGFRLRTPDRAGLPLNATMPVEGARLVEIGLGTFYGGIYLYAGGEVFSRQPAESLEGDGAARLEARARAFVSNVSTLDQEEQEAWVAAFLANRTPYTGQGFQGSGTPVPFTTIHYRSTLPGPYRLDTLYEQAVANGEVNAGAERTHISFGDWRMLVEHPYWSRILGDSESVSVDAAGRVEYYSEAGPAHQPQFGKPSVFQRQIEKRFDQEGLPAPSFQELEVEDNWCGDYEP